MNNEPLHITDPDDLDNRYPGLGCLAAIFLNVIAFIIGIILLCSCCIVQDIQYSIDNPDCKNTIPYYVDVVDTTDSTLVGDW